LRAVGGRHWQMVWETGALGFGILGP